MLIFKTIFRIVFIYFIFFSTFFNHAYSQVNDQWGRVSYPLASSVRSFAEGTDHVYFVASSAGVFKSKDRGSSWESAGLDELHIDEVFVTDRNTLLAGTYRSGMYRSVDGGENWKSVGFEKNIYIFSILQTKDKNLFATASYVSDKFDRNSTPVGIFKSTDDGQTWANIFNDEKVYGLSNPNSELLFAFGESGLYSSTDQGERWNKCGNGLPESIPVSSIISHKKALFASVGNRRDASGQKGGGVYRSDDSGKTWVRSDIGIAGNARVNCLLSYKGHMYAGLGSQDGNDSQGIFISTDNGETWISVGMESSVRLIHITADKTLIAGTDGDCMYLSKDKGMSWKQAGSGIDNWDTYSICTSKKQLFVSDMTGRIWRGKNNEWTEIGKGVVCALPSGRLLTFENKKIKASDDLGETWQSMYELDRNLVFFKSLNDTLVVACTNEGILFSTDEGITWSKYDISGYNDAGFRTALITPTGTIVAGYMKGNDAGLLRSADFGKTWQKVHQDLWTWSLMYHNGKIFSGNFSKGILVSTDEGRTWILSNEGLLKNDEYTTVTSMISVNDSTIVCGTLGKGIFLSKNNGISWQEFNVGLSNLFNWDLLIDEKKVLYTTTLKGVFGREFK